MTIVHISLLRINKSILCLHYKSGKEWKSATVLPSMPFDQQNGNYQTLNCGMDGLVSLDVKTSSTVSLESSMIMERSLPEEKGLFVGSSASGVNRSIRSSK